MSDDALRRLEREWRATGSPALEAEWLQARVRASQLRADHLELAAAWGYGPARAALGQDTPSGDADLALLARRTLEVGGGTAVVACARGVMEAMVEHAQPRLPDELRALIARAAAELPDTRGDAALRLRMLGHRLSARACVLALSALRFDTGRAQDVWGPLGHACDLATKATQDEQAVRDAIARRVIAWALRA